MKTFVFLLLMTGAALAQATTPPSSVLTLNEILAPWLPTLIGAFMALALALLSAATLYIKKRFNLEDNTNFLRAEQNARETLQSALGNAAGRVILVLGDKLKNVKLDVGMPEIRSAVLQVNAGAADAIKQFDLSEGRLKEMIIDKIGVLTAANPDVVPTAHPLANRAKP